METSRDGIFLFFFLNNILKAFTSGAFAAQLIVSAKF